MYLKSRDQKSNNRPKTGCCVVPRSLGPVSSDHTHHMQIIITPTFHSLPLALLSSLFYCPDNPDLHQNNY